MRFLLALLLSVTLAYPATWYVSTTGNDSWDGTAAAFVSGTTGPFRTIRKGMQTMAGGDTLYLRGGTYQELRLHDSSTAGILIKSGISDSQRTVIASYPGERAVFQPTWADGGAESALNTASGRDGPRYMTFDGFTIDGGAKTVLQPGRNFVKFYGAYSLTFTNMHFLNNTNGQGVQMFAQPKNETLSMGARLGTNLLIASCVFSNFTRTATFNGQHVDAVHPIYVYPATGMVIENNIFRYSHSSAIAMGSIGGQTHEAIVTNMVVRNNDIRDFAHGIRLGKSVGTRVYNNVIRNISVGTHPTGGTSYNLGSALYVTGLSNIVANNAVYGAYEGMRIERSLTAYPSMAKAHANQIHNNIVWNTTRAGIWIEHENGSLTGTNWFFNNLYPNKGETSGWNEWAHQILSANKEGTFYDPSFLSPPDDLRIGSGSDARAVGTNLAGIFTTDHYANTRTEPWDMGAFIFNSAPSGEDPPDPDPDPLPLVSVVQTGDAFELGQAFSTFTITRAGSLDGNLNVVFAMTGSAASNVNYTLSHSSPMTIANAEATATLTLTPVDLSTIGTMDAILTIVPDAAYTVSSVNSATMTIYGSGQVQPGFRRTFGGGAATGRRGL